MALVTQNLTHLSKSLKRVDIELIIAANHKMLTSAQRKVAKKHNLITREMLSTFERTKADLHLFDYDLDQLFKSGNYDGMSDIELAKLRKSVKDKVTNTEKKEKQVKIVEGEEEKNSLNEDTASNGTSRLNHVVNHFFNEFNSSPCLDCLKRLNQNNQVAFYQFVLSLPKCPIPSFLQMLSEVIALEGEADQKLRLFHAFCGLYDGKWMGNFDGLCIPAVNYLASTQQIGDKHAQGFLRYAFVNGVDLACDARVAAIFDNKFPRIWLQLGISLWSNLYDQSMFNFLPSTIMVMRQPMIKALKSDSLAAIPPVFFRVALGILTYSCAHNESVFQQLLFQFNEPLIKNYMKAETTSLLALCLNLEKELMGESKLWRAQPLTVISFLKNVHEMVRLDKVPGGKFTPDVCAILLSDNNASEYLKRPSYKKHSCIDEDGFLDDLIALNSSSKCTASALQFLKRKNIQIDLSLFKHLLLTPSPIQEVCIKLLQLNSRVFICPQAGTGKSTLMNALIIQGASQGKQVIVVNPFKELLFRDYVTVRTLTKQMNLNIQVQLIDQQQQNITACICFVTFEQLLQTELPQTYHLLIDEFQEELYSEKVFPLIPFLRKAVSVTAFSGSSILEEHTSVLQVILPQSLVVRFPDIYPNTLTEEIPYFCTSMQSQVAQISKEMEKHRANGPIITIGTEGLADMYMKKVSQKKKANTILLFGEHCSVIKLDQLLTAQNFCESVNIDQYKVYFTLKEGGVGIDYPSTDTINKAGGNIVIVCIEPTTYSQLVQFRRRTARMGAPGIVIYILRGNNVGTDPNYLNILERVLQEQELQAVIRLYHRLTNVEYQETALWNGEVLFKLSDAKEIGDEDSEEKVGDINAIEDKDYNVVNDHTMENEEKKDDGQCMPAVQKSVIHVGPLDMIVDRDKVKEYEKDLSQQTDNTLLKEGIKSAASAINSSMRRTNAPKEVTSLVNEEDKFLSNKKAKVEPTNKRNVKHDMKTQNKLSSNQTRERQRIKQQ